jgi:hypothetical protein
MHNGTEVETDNVWIYEFESGALRRPLCLRGYGNSSGRRELMSMQ